MGKNEIVKEIASQAGVTNAAANQLVTLFLERVKEVTLEEGRVQIVGFGTFNKHVSKPRKARNPRTGEPIDVPSKTTIKFKNYQ